MFLLAEEEWTDCVACEATSRAPAAGPRRRQLGRAKAGTASSTWNVSESLTQFSEDVSDRLRRSDLRLCLRSRVILPRRDAGLSDDDCDAAMLASRWSSRALSA